MTKELRDKLVLWLKNKTKEDIIYVKNNPEIIFSKHPGMCEFEAEQLVEDCDNITDVEITYNERLKVLRIGSKRFNIEYIILDPFNQYIEKKFKNKIAIVTFYIVKRN